MASTGSGRNIHQDSGDTRDGWNLYNRRGSNIATIMPPIRRMLPPSERSLPKLLL